MMRDPSTPPDGFVSYVEKRLPSVMKGARRLTSDERLADDFARELFVPLAGRWDRLSRADAKHGENEGTGADRLLHRLFRAGISDLTSEPSVRPELTLDATPWPGQQQMSFMSSPLSPAVEAALLWERAYRNSRRRLLIAGGVGVIAVALFLGRPRYVADTETAVPEESPEPSPSRPARLPAGIDVLPALIDQAALPPRVTPIPHDLDLSRTVGNLGDKPAGRAIALFQEFDNGPLIVLGPDRGLRLFATTNSIGSTAVLSPDGLLAAFPAGNHIDLLDIATAKIRQLPSGGASAPPVWLDPHHLMEGEVGSSLIIDVRTGATIEVPSVVNDAVVPRAVPVLPAGGDVTPRVQFMLSVGQPVTAPARIRRWTSGFKQQIDVAVGGDLGGWIGKWRGLGYAFGDGHGLIVRCCQVASRPLPEGMGDAIGGIVVVRAATGVVLRLLLDTSLTGNSRTEVLGWLDPDTVLLSTGTLNVMLLLAWRIDTGRLELVSISNKGSRISVADLTERRD